MLATAAAFSVIAAAGELKAAAKDAIDSSSLSRGSMSGGGRQVAEAAGVFCEHALHISPCQWYPYSHRDTTPSCQAT